MGRLGIQVSFEDGETQTQYLEAQIADVVKAIVHFRPLRNWKGEYGFDWFRDNLVEKETKANKIIDYNTWVGNYYTDATFRSLFQGDNSWSNFFQLNQPALQDLKNTYSPFNTYSVEDDGLGNEITKEYFIPKLALFAETDNILPFNAELQLYLEFGINEVENPERIEFEISPMIPVEPVPEIPITIDPPIINNPGNKVKLNIACTDVFDEDVLITAYAVRGTGRIEAGKIQVIAPSKKREKEVVIVRVKSKRGTTGNIRRSVLRKTEKILKQSLTTLNLSLIHI